MKYLFNIFFLFALVFSCSNDKAPQYSNALINESSPYLLQHAHNPVNWYPWGEKALQKAKSENKLLLISIGYAACHWCHVMEEESFQDTAVANIMNRYFVSIKVDREERPDVDDIYMTACQIAGQGSCGWPLNAIALPDGRPVWAGTYFPKKQWIEILNYFVETQKTQSDKLEQYAAGLVDGLHLFDSIPVPNTNSSFKEDSIKKITEVFLNNIDFENGGIIGNIKFPMPVAFEYLLENDWQFSNEKARSAIMISLNKMAKGGIYDQLGGGFARYSTDKNWHIPHFEKMLYDNGQLLSLFSHAYQVNPDPLFEDIIRSTIAFTERELSHPEGAFYASINADSEGEEGTFYVWTKEEIEQLLPDEESRSLVIDHFGILVEGNWEEGKNVLAIQKSVAELSQAFNLTEEEVSDRLKKAKGQLFEDREKRTRPSLDDKVLTSWNALMITGYLDAYQALGEPTYLQRALQAAGFITEHMIQADGQLHRNFKDGQSSINAFLDDYALSIHAFLSLYEITFELHWLEKASLLNKYVLSHFQEEESPLFYFTSDEDPPLFSRIKQISDNVIPSSNSVMARNLYQLGLLYDDKNLINHSKAMLSVMIPNMKEVSDPVYYANWARLYLEILNPPYEVVIVGKNYANLKDELLNHYLPNTLLLGGPEENELPLLKNKYREGKTMIYVCQNKVCKLPVETVEEALVQIK